MIDNFRVLLLTDEAFSRQASSDLQAAGYYPVIEKEIIPSWQKFNIFEPAMIIIDKKRSGQSGINFCHQLRKDGVRIPILMLIEEDTVTERTACIEAGADDYLLKPYNQEKLLSLIHLYLEPTVNVSEQLRFGELVLDLTTHQAIRNGSQIDLTAKEFELLKYLMSNPNKVLSRERIIENVWGYDYQGESNVIEVYIRYLRLKIEVEGQKRLIQTVRGVGYVLRDS